MEQMIDWLGKRPAVGGAIFGVSIFSGITIGKSVRHVPMAPIDLMLGIAVGAVVTLALMVLKKFSQK